ncbi:uncharacterized protein DNG_09271 [Cephalotrichum gorgonifer]|uniref:NADPH-dependent reductive aminase-like C-terminal domain-containing protein n=1 Tax=Cephalotrichum gorgonifer TaxID=2041049 RepID=A0AAE8N5D0_9PEZI|nr:uncharacterized protein DNG_09271 [Cephalotrichum gorgonifer]
MHPSPAAPYSATRLHTPFARDLGKALQAITPVQLSFREPRRRASGPQTSDQGIVCGLLAAFGNGQYLGSETGAASRFDNGLLVQMYGMFLGMFLGLGIMKKGSPDGNIGSSIDGMVPLLQALVPLMGMIARRWDAGEFTENDGHPMNMLVEGIETIRRTCEESGVDFGTMELFLERMKAAEVLVVVKGGFDNSALGPSLFPHHEADLRQETIKPEGFGCHTRFR